MGEWKKEVVRPAPIYKQACDLGDTSIVVQEQNGIWKVRKSGFAGASLEMSDEAMSAIVEAVQDIKQQIRDDTVADNAPPSEQAAHIEKEG